MDAVKFFRSDALRLPLVRSEKDGDFERYLAGVFERYLAEFSSLKTEDNLTKAIKAAEPNAKELCDAVREAVREYLLGFPHGAFQAFRQAVAGVDSHIGLLRRGNDVAGIPLLQELFRIRVERPDEQPKGMWFRREDLFHIPFEKRHLVGRQRYSIPGLPCLYLGSTLYVCWEEMGRPPFHSLYAARFRAHPAATVALLDFSSTPAAAARLIEDKRDDLSDVFAWIVARAVCWPLVAACAVRRLHGNAPFIAEYIVPQLVLQWIARPDSLGNKALDGVVYFSVSADPIPSAETALLNYVFPVQKPQAQGHCPVLKEKFEMTEPGSWQLLENSGLDSAAPPLHAPIKIPVVRGTNLGYLHTPFGMVESRLGSLPHSRLSSSDVSPF